MKKILITLVFVTFGLFMLLVYSGNVKASSDGCYNCSSSSSMNQCKHCGGDTQAQRENCKKAGCTITGTSSCSTSANVKVINPNGC